MSWSKLNSLVLFIAVFLSGIDRLQIYFDNGFHNFALGFSILSLHVLQILCLGSVKMMLLEILSLLCLNAACAKLFKLRHWQIFHEKHLGKIHQILVLIYFVSEIVAHRRILDYKMEILANSI